MMNEDDGISSIGDFVKKGIWLDFLNLFRMLADGSDGLQRKLCESQGEVQN